MKNQEIIENNRLIAEFMGFNTSPSGELYHVVINNNHLGYFHPATMLFHNSWDWLMPVIDKITSLDEYSKYVDYTSSMVDSGGIFINTRFISVTHEQVIDFIKWHNANK